MPGDIDARQHDRFARGRRLWIALGGDSDATRADAERFVARLEPSEVLWIAEYPVARFTCVAPRAEAQLLGQAFDAVVLDMHRGLDPDVLGRCHGFVRGGGVLVLRMPVSGVPPLFGLAAFPYGAQDVTRRFWRRFELVLSSHRARHPAPCAPIDVPSHAPRATPEQDEVVQALSQLVCSETPSVAVLLADRGRGKSAALGRAVSAFGTLGATGPLAVSATHPTSLAEVLRFGPAGLAPTAPLDLVRGDAPDYQLIVIDEAAQLPVPLLRRVCRRHPRAHLVFATTVRGYEGTGRGFALRFVPWLEGEPRPVSRLGLETPIRWAAGCPLERLVFDALLLDAQPASIRGDEDLGAIVACEFDRDALVASERDLRQLFGLLVEAHYRTTPGDLMRLLDAPNLGVHALRLGAEGDIVAACLVAREGGLPAAVCDEMLRGRRRIRAHALPDALVSHLGHSDAGRLAMVRSVRIAVHTRLRRRGLASRLVAHVHERYRPDLFGTIFGATAELVAFRRRLGYQVVRVSASRGARTGEPAVVMIHPVSARARELTRVTRAELARELPRQLELFRNDGELHLEPALERALLEGLPEPAPLTPARRDALVRAYATGPRTMESVATALASFVAEHRDRLTRLEPAARALVVGRILEGRGWTALAHEVGLAHAGLAMRALRRHVRRLLDAG